MKCTYNGTFKHSFATYMSGWACSDLCSQHLRHIVRYCQRQSHRCRKQRSDTGWLVRKVRTQDFYPSAERRFLCRVKFRERLNPNPDFIVSFYPSLRPRCGHNHVGYQKCGTLSHIFAICHPPELVRVLLWLSP